MAYNRVSKSKKALQLFIIFFAFLSLVSNARAQNASPTVPAGNYKLLEPLPCIQDEVNKCDSTNTNSDGYLSTVNLETFFRYAYNLLVALASVAAVFMMVYGGFLYVTTDSWQDKKTGKTYFFNALIGVGMILISYLVLQTVNPKLVQFPEKIPPLKSSYQPFSIDTFFQDLNREASAYHLTGQQFVDEAKASKKNVEVLLKKKTELENRLSSLRINNTGLDPDNQEEKALELEIAKTDDQIRNEKAEIELKLAKSIINNAAIGETFDAINLKQNINGSMTTESLKKEIRNGINRVDTTKETRARELKALGAAEFITRPGGLEDVAAAAKLTLRIREVDIIASKSTAKVPIQGTSWYPTAKLPNDIYLDNQNLGSAPDVAKKYTAEVDALAKEVSKINDDTLKSELEAIISVTKEDMAKKFK